MFRFFLNYKIEDPQNIVIKDKDIFHKLTKVLRKQVGDTFFVFDNQAEEYEVEIIGMDNKQIICKGLSRNFIDRELNLGINLYQSLLKKDKFEWVLQKATEIGVKKITPVLSENCVVDELNNNKIERYQKIINEATLQSGGKIAPQFETLKNFSETIEMLDSQALNLIAHELEQEKKFKDVFAGNQFASVNLFIGPEGGFSEDEINLALRNSLIPFSLGKRILRAETAAIVACGLLANL